MSLRLVRSTEFWYPSLMFGLGLCQQVVVQWAVFFYAPPDSTAAYLLAGQIGTAMVLGRIVDALADPVVAFFSDRSRLHLGRRRPFMLYGTPVMILAFILLWLPPAGDVSAVNVSWAVTMLGLFFLSYSVIVVPYLALLPEIATSEAQRVRLSALQAAFYGAGVVFGLLVTTVLAPFLGIPTLSALLSPVAIGAILWTTYMASEEAPGPEPASSVHWMDAWRSVVRDRVFMLWIAVQGLNRAALIVIFMLFPYLLTVFLRIESPWDISPVALAVALGGAALSGLAAYRSIQRRGLDAVYGRSLIIAGLASAASAFVAAEPFSAHPQLQGAVLFAGAAGSLGLIILLPNAVIADIARRRRQRRGEHWEALLYAVQGVAVKLCIAGGSAAVGFQLHAFGGGFTEPLGIRLSLLTAGLLLLLSHLVFRYYVLYKDRDRVAT